MNPTSKPASHAESAPSLAESPENWATKARILADAELNGKLLVMRVIPQPKDSNINGDIFGGWVMAQVDLAGSVLPAQVIKGRFATVAVKEFVFKAPVKVGDLLSFYAQIVKVGRTSVTVSVEVLAHRRWGSDTEAVQVTEATLTYVSIGADGRPAPIQSAPVASGA